MTSKEKRNNPPEASQEHRQIIDPPPPRDTSEESSQAPSAERSKTPSIANVRQTSVTEEVETINVDAAGRLGKSDFFSGDGARSISGVVEGTVSGVNIATKFPDNTPIDGNNNRLSNLQDPQNPQDAATKAYVDSSIPVPESAQGLLLFSTKDQSFVEKDPVFLMDWEEQTTNIYNSISYTSASICINTAGIYKLEAYLSIGYDGATLSSPPYIHAFYRWNYLRDGNYVGSTGTCRLKSDTSTNGSETKYSLQSGCTPAIAYVTAREGDKFPLEYELIIFDTEDLENTLFQGSSILVQKFSEGENDTPSTNGEGAQSVSGAVSGNLSGTDIPTTLSNSIEVDGDEQMFSFNSLNPKGLIITSQSLTAQAGFLAQEIIGENSFHSGMHFSAAQGGAHAVSFISRDESFLRFSKNVKSSTFKLVTDELDLTEKNTLIVGGTVDAPTEDKHIANKAYVDSSGVKDLTGVVEGSIAGTNIATSFPASQDINANTNKIINVVDPQNLSDVATKRYVDANSNGIAVPQEWLICSFSNEYQNLELGYFAFDKYSHSTSDQNLITFSNVPVGDVTSNSDPGVGTVITLKTGYLYEVTLFLGLRSTNGGNHAGNIKYGLYDTQENSYTHSINGLVELDPTGDRFISSLPAHGFFNAHAGDLSVCPYIIDWHHPDDKTKPNDFDFALPPESRIMVKVCGIANALPVTNGTF